MNFDIGQDDTSDEQDLETNQNLDFTRFVFDEIPLVEPPPMRTGIASVLNVQGLRVRLKDIRSNSKMNIKFNNRVILPRNFMQVFE